jgi:mannitol/fructose-specific phosphotransferase system IIA component (Ntr-type)
MRVTDIITVGGIRVQQSCQSFEGAVRDLVTAMVQQGQLPVFLEGQAIEAICDRERMASTVIVEIGVSVPHARIEGIQGVVGALATSPTAVYYAMANVPITIMALVLSARSLAAEHLNVLSSLSLVLQSGDLRQALQEAKDAGQAFSILQAGVGGA